jgi:hypothetical protein
MSYPDIQPPAARGSPALDPHSLSPARAASVHRHPSSPEVAAPQTCLRCGFEAPAASDVVAEILRIPDRWAPGLRSSATPQLLIGAARTRDELHVVANRIARVLAMPGSATLAEMPLDTPTASARLTNADHLITVLRLAAERLARVVSSLRQEDWSLTGQAGRTSISVRDLALIPLHRSHGRLTRGQMCP